jgi:hypothetical protein
MKGIFPYDKQEILIRIPKKDLLDELRKDIQLTCYIPFFKNKKQTTFYGYADKDTWIVILKTDYRNSFKPIVYMKLLSEENNTRMILEFKLHILAKIVLSLFLIIPMVVIVFNVISHVSVDGYYFPLIFICFTLIISNFGFYMTLGHTAQALNKTIRAIVMNRKQHLNDSI